MTTKEISQAIKKASVTEQKGRKGMYTVDLTEAGYNASMDVKAKDADEAREKAMESLKETPEHLLPQPIEE